MANTVRIRNGMTNATEGDILGSASDIVKDLGVVDKAGGHLLVTENTPKGMSVQVAGGIVYVPNANYNPLDSDTPKFYPVVCSAEVLTIDNNVSGSTRTDIVCVKVDKVIIPDPDADNIATKVVIKGTPGAGVPATPANHYKLAEITVVNGETSIENSMITDKRGQVIFDERYTKLTTSTPTDLTGYLYGNGSNVGVQVPVPSGAVLQFAGSIAPTGYLLCDGSAVSRTTYSALFSAISTTYGAGDGSTTFNLPNLKGKVAVGYNSAETEFNALGKTGGAKTHTLTVGEMPTHSHGYPSASAPAGSLWGAPGSLVSEKAGDIVTSSVGGGGSHNNLQPYIVLNYIIKT